MIDARDEWPHIFFEFFPRWLHSIIKVILWNDFQIVKKCFKSATHITSMSESTLEWALLTGNKIKTADDRVFYLGAKKIFWSPEATQKFSYIEGAAKGKFVVIFIGNFNEFYNPIILIEVAKILSNLNIYFILGGSGIYYKKAKEQSAGLKNVALTGWLSEQEIAFLLSFSNVGVIPCSKKIKAFPNKAFTYFSAGLPVISSVEGELKESIGKNNMGFYYQSKNAVGLANGIKRMYEDRSLHKKMSKNVNDIFDKLFDANKIYQQYVEYLENITKWK